MKKILITAALIFLMPVAAYAQGIDLNGDMSQGTEIEVSGLADGFYDLTVTSKSDIADENTYVYGVSDGYTMSSTVIPKSENGTLVTVRGIGVTDGKCKIGVSTSGKSKIEFSGADLTASKAHNLYTGGDMSEVSYIESLGGKYRDADGAEVDPFEFLSKNGVNMARIRLSNTTGKGTGDGTYYLPQGFQDENDCLKLAKRAKDTGMAIQFTFNYSDYWSNADRQIIPSAWVKQIKEELGYDVKDADFLKKMTDAEKKEIQDKLVEIVYDYTYDIMTRLKKQGTTPEYVSLGNEINGGLFYPFANAYDANMNSDRFELVWGDNKDDENDIKCVKDMDCFKRILKSGYDAVKAVSPDTQVIIHFATKGNDGINDGNYTWIMDEAVAAGAVDVLGASYYPAWSDSTASQCADFCIRMYEKYNKPVMIMETGFNWNAARKDGYAGQLKDIEAYADTYPPSIDGHKGYMAELMNELKRAGDSCAGVLYWDPCMIHVEDSQNPKSSLSGWAIRESDDKADANVVENTTLFDFDGKAIPSVDVFKNTRSASLRKDLIIVSRTNNSDISKKVCLYTVVYDSDGKLTGVNIVSEDAGANAKYTLEIEKPSGKYKTYLWDGNSLSQL